MSIQRLQAPDFDITMHLFHRYRDEAIEAVPYIEEEYDENSAIDTVREYAILNTHCWLNLYKGQRPIGFVGGFLVSKPWNARLYFAHIQFIYVVPEERNLENFRDLLEAFTEWAKERKADSISAGDIGINPDKMKSLYEHFGFTSVLSVEKKLNYE